MMCSSMGLRTEGSISGRLSRASFVREERKLFIASEQIPLAGIGDARCQAVLARGRPRGEVAPKLQPFRAMRSGSISG